MTTTHITRAFWMATACLMIAGCDEQDPLIDADNALRVASCALSPTNLPELTLLAATLRSKTTASCINGGVLLRTDTANSVQIKADNCRSEDNNTLGGLFTWTDLSAAPTTVEWNFDQISNTNALGDGSSVHGVVTSQQSETPTAYLTTFAFASLSLDEFESSLSADYVYGATEQTVTESKALGSASIEYTSKIELCGFDPFALDVSTLSPVVQFSTDSSPSQGQVEAVALDGSKLTISIDGELLALELDSNGDEVNDLRLSMSWGEFNVAVLASRSRPPTAQTLFPLPRYKAIQH